MTLQLHRQKTMTEDTEKAEVLIEISVSVFTGKSSLRPLTLLTGFSRVKQYPRQRKTQLGITQACLISRSTVGLDEMPLRMLRELADTICMVVPIFFERRVLTGESKCHTCLQERQEGGYRELQTSHLTSVPGKLMDQILLENLPRHTKNQKTIRNSKHGSTKNKLCSINPVTFYDGICQWMMGKLSVDIIQQAFDTVCNILMAKLVRHGQYKWTVRYVECWLDHQDQRVVIHSSKSDYWPDTQRHISGINIQQIILTIFVNDLDNRVRCTPSKLTGSTKLGGAFDMPEGRTSSQRILKRLHKRAVRNLMEIKKGKWKVMHLGWNNPVQKLSVNWLESSFVQTWKVW